MNLGLQNKTAIVTGGASNIGKAIVEGFSEEGANVVIADIDQAQGERVAEKLQESGDSQILFVQTDVSDRSQVEHMVNKTLKIFGQIDILVNNAGWTVNGLFLEKSMSEWEKEVAINLWGPIHCVREVAPSMVAQSSGKIITIGSDAGRVGENQEAVYSACKGGIIALSKSLAREFGRDNVTVNVVSPGLTLPENIEDAGTNSLWHHESPQGRIFRDKDTLAKIVKRYPLKRIGAPDDLVPMVLLLSSDKSSYITGQVISVSGGYAM